MIDMYRTPYKKNCLNGTILASLLVWLSIGVNARTIHWITFINNSSLKTCINNLQCDTTDIIVFYFIGHGTRMSEDMANSTNYPYLYFDENVKNCIPLSCGKAARICPEGKATMTPTGKNPLTLGGQIRAAFPWLKYVIDGYENSSFIINQQRTSKLY